MKKVSIIIADNNSTDNSIEWLKTNYPHIQTIILDKNYGFTGGYNRALNQIDAEYFILLNSDIFTPDNWLQPLIQFMESHKGVGVCQPKMLSEKRREEILQGRKEKNQFEYAGACGGFIDKFGFPLCRGRILATVEDDYGQYDNARRIFWASGACMVVRSSVWRELNGLDESFFAHMEEIDFCWRAQLLGYEIWVVPESSVYHVGGGTLPNNSPRKLFYNYRNNLLMLYKNLPINQGWEAFGLKGKHNRNTLIFKRMCIDGLTAIIYIFQFKPKFFTAVFKAHTAFRKMKKIRQLPFQITAVIYLMVFSLKVFWFVNF
jgi:Predicted glycosyltransferases